MTLPQYDVLQLWAHSRAWPLPGRVIDSGRNEIIFSAALTAATI